VNSARWLARYRRMGQALELRDGAMGALDGLAREAPLVRGPVIVVRQLSVEGQRRLRFTKTSQKAKPGPGDVHDPPASPALVRPAARHGPDLVDRESQGGIRAELARDPDQRSGFEQQRGPRFTALPAMGQVACARFR